MVYFRTRPEFRSGGIWLVPVPVRYRQIWPVPDRYRFFFHVVFRFYDELPASRAPPVLWLDHVHPSGSQTVSRATLQFPDCITCSPPVPRLYHVLPSSSQNVSCPPPPPFGDTWRGILSLFSPFVTFIDFTLSTDISA